MRFQNKVTPALIFLASSALIAGRPAPAAAQATGDRESAPATERRADNCRPAAATESMAGESRAVEAAGDPEYAARIKEYTTDPRFLNELVDHLPASETVPSPLDHFGTIIGAPDILHNTTEIYGYMRALAEASPRVAVRTIGHTEEGREMIEVIVADEATIADLERYRGYLNRLADPRTLTEEEAHRLIGRAKPIYYFTAGLHSPETGPPEMVMELAYRLAVEESPWIRAIREHEIVIIVPATEADGRDRMVDTYRYAKDHDDVGPGLLYWGRYVAHDNNRDGNGFGLALTRNILDAYLHWKPTVLHDLHESGFYLYTSTGSGPYNEVIDPLTIDEWHNLAHEEVTQLTRRGMPGVWTHAFYTGWAANYLMWIANTRNSIGRFYETLGNRGADTRERKLPERATSREWYRPNPPLGKAMWSLRNNTNYMESGVLVALKYVADHRREFLESFYLRGKRSVERGATETPHAWVIPADQRRALAAADLANLLLRQGIEVQVAEEDLAWERDTGTDAAAAAERTAARGAYVIRMDQPYRNLIQILLGEQHFPKNATPPYDDTGWTLPYLHGVQAFAVDDSTILKAKLRPLAEPIRVAGSPERRARPFYLLDNTTDDQIAVFRFRLADVAMEAAETPFEAEGTSYSAGSFLIPAEGNPPDLADRLKAAAGELGLRVRGVRKRPDVPTHELDPPRVALVHTWVSTPQDAGWWRLAFDRLDIPYTYLSEQDLRENDLSDLDVVILPSSRADPQTLVQGTTVAGPALPWRRSDRYPALGVIDQTDDVRAGMGYEGLAHLKAFLERGGVLLVERGSVRLPIEMALTRRVSVNSARRLTARGTVLRTTVADEASPIAYGYPKEFDSYFNQFPVLRVNENVGGTETPEWLKDERWEKEVPRVVVRFAKKDVLRSGMLRGESEIAGTPAVVDAPVGRGHVVLFATGPFWRLETTGSHALVFNTLLNWNDLRVGRGKRPPEDERSAGEDAEVW
ncbi:MAG: M14 family zinc carboxypeptidase [Gemmatimonadota bacterium]